MVEETQRELLVLALLMEMAIFLLALRGGQPRRRQPRADHPAESQWGLWEVVETRVGPLR